MSTSSYAGRHRPARKHPRRRIPLRRPAALRSGFVLPTSAALALVITATGASVAESHNAPSVEAGADARGTVAGALGAAALDVDVPDASEPGTTPAATGGDTADLAAREEAAKQAALDAERAAEQAARDQRAAAARAAAHRWVQPMRSGRFTSGFKMRWGRMHEGDDFATPVGTPIRAMSSGTVIWTGWWGGGGHTTKIRYWDGTVSFYEHQSRFAVKVGQRVTPGQLVGYSGSTGHSTGPHLHVEIHPKGGAAVNPRPWLLKHRLFVKQLS